MVEAFDDAHSALKAEKLGLEADIKAGEMRLLVAQQELALLREFDKRESVLLGKRQAKMDDKQVGERALPGEGRGGGAAARPACPAPGVCRGYTGAAHCSV